MATLLESCAPMPSQAVNALDPANPNYRSPECIEARRQAMAHQESVGKKVAGGIGLALLLGPFAIPAGVLIDVNDSERREALSAEVVKHCAGEPRPYYVPLARPQDTPPTE